MRRIPGLLLPLALLPLAGCGASDSAQEVVAGAAAATIEAGNALTSMHLEMSLPGVGQVEMDMEGVIDFDNQSTELTVDLGELGMGGTIKVRSLGATVYMQSELFTEALPGVDGDTWLRIDLEEAARQSGIDLGQLKQLGTNDPRQGLAVLTGVVDGGVQKLGEEDVRGTKTTRYRVRIDLEKAAEESAAIIDREAFDRFVESTGSDTVRVEVWIDDDNQVRRLRMPFPRPKEAGNGEALLTLEYYDFGEGVEVSEPPAGEIVDFGELLEQVLPTG